MAEKVFPENRTHPLLHFHISHSVFLNCYLTTMVNGAQLIIFIVVFMGLFSD